MDETAKHTFSTMARAHYYNEGDGVLYVDVPAGKSKYIPMCGMDPNMKAMVEKEIDADDGKFVYMAIVDASGSNTVHIAKSRLPTFEVRSDAPFISVVVCSDEETVSNVTKYCIENLTYPRDKIELVVGKTWNDAVSMAKGDVIVHMYDGDIYHENCIQMFLKGLENNRCMGCLSLFVYDKETGRTFYSMDDALCVKGIKIGAVAYYKTFWEERRFAKTDDVHDMMFRFIKDRERDVDVVSPLEIVCCVDSYIDGMTESVCTIDKKKYLPLI